jgi:hypothetical protein
MSTCFRCNDTYNSFVPTPCGHKICLSCLVNFASKHSSTKCPKCDCDFSVKPTGNNKEVIRHLVKSVNVKMSLPAPRSPVSPHDTKLSQVSAKKIPVIREPGPDASPYEKKLYDRKVTIKSFNDNKGSFTLLDGRKIRVSDFHILLKEGKIDKDFDDKFFLASKYVFDDQAVFVPLFTTDSTDHVVHEKTPTVKKPPTIKVPGPDASLYEKTLYDRKTTIKSFNDNKGTFTLVDGRPIRITDFHFLLKEGKIDKDFDDKSFQCTHYEFKGEGERDIFVPHFVPSEPEKKPEKIAEKKEEVAATAPLPFTSEVSTSSPEPVINNMFSRMSASAFGEI